MKILISLLVVATLSCLLVSRKAVLYHYEINKEGITIRVFGVLRIMRLTYKEITEIRAYEWWRLDSGGWVPLTLKNRYAKKFVVIEKKSGVFRRVVITPDHPEDFVASVKAHMRESNE